MFGFTFELGVLNTIEIVLVRTGIGKVNAAAGTALLINNFKPDYIVNIGIAGTFHDEIEIGDIVLASEVRHHDVDVTLFGYEPGQVPDLPPSFQGDPALVRLARQLANHTTHVGQIVSGDNYFDDADTVHHIKAKFPHACAVEMEAAAIGHVCWLAAIPFLIIRSISDKPGRNGQESFQQNICSVSDLSASLLVKIVEIGSIGFNSLR